MPPAWLTQYWKDETNWVKRFVSGSFELNSSLCGLTVTKDTIWTKSVIKQFLKYMNTIQQTTKKPTILYRGTRVLSPTMSPPCFNMVSCQFMSSTKSLFIAKEFAGKDGFVHVMNCHKGVKIYDLHEIYRDDPVAREKEVIIYPGCHLIFIKKIGNKLYWDIISDPK